jgi:hypothetical protein
MARAEAEMSRPVEFRNTTPFATGGKRFVFRHPDDPSLIVKVLQPAYLRRQWSEPLSPRRRMKRYKHLFSQFQEVREHIAICTVEGRPPKYMQTLVGFMDTDYGPGLVYKAVFAPDGGFAPTLEDLVQSRRYTAEIAAAYAEFRAWLIEAPIVLTPLRPDNIVCARDEIGAPYFVLIDGIGERGTIPFKGMVPYLNKRSKLKDLRRMEDWLKLPATPDPGT